MLCAFAVSPAAFSASPNNIAAALVVEGPVEPGGSVTLAIHMRPAPGWHGYWLNPGDAGLGMRLHWTLPQGFTAGEPDYPVPKTLLISGLMNHVYDREHAVLVPLRAPANARPGNVIPVTLDARWLACTDEVCVPEQGRLTAQVRIGQQGADAVEPSHRQGGPLEEPLARPVDHERRVRRQGGRDKGAHRLARGGGGVVAAGGSPNHGAKRE